MSSSSSTSHQATLSHRCGSKTLDSEYETETTRHFAWMEILRNIPVLHEDLLYIVLNYLCVTGCYEAAEELTRESGAIPEMPLQSIALRQKIYSAILGGYIDEALEGLNQIDPLILKLNYDTNFKLKQQKLFKFIEQHDDEAALLFAQNELAPCVKEHPHLLPQLEEAMTRLAFPNVSVTESTLEHEEMARTVDDAILQFFAVSKEPILECLLKNLVWTQKRILDTFSDPNNDVKIPPIPFLLSPAIGGFLVPPSVSGSSLCPRATPSHENFNVENLDNDFAEGRD